ncbi:unnamed protein product [Adineta ricciae]|uniref:NHL repeat containing protein n=1 Tax=Adineta ricciae TaxID=249248 RepID=A0A815MIX2_ADIRI|nr:unnamed protein product [Adineta ricciae]
MKTWILIAIMIIQHELGISLNQSKFSLCAQWSDVAVTFADQSCIGLQPTGIFINSQNNIFVTERQYGQILTVDGFGQIYVADCYNHRIVRWCKAKEGELIIGGNGQGEKTNQLSYPGSLSFDVDGNLYIADGGNNRIQRFDLICE